MKSKISLLFYFVFIFIFLGCNSESESYERLADKLTINVANKLEETKQLHLIGIGGQMMDDIQMMNMGFQHFHQIDLQTGRELLIYAIKEYLNAINNDEKLRPYLHEYPFTSKNVEIDIWLQNPDKSDVPSDQIYYISAIEGELSYYIDDPKNNSRKAILKETFEEALEEISLIGQ